MDRHKGVGGDARYLSTLLENELHAPTDVRCLHYSGVSSGDSCRTSSIGSSAILKVLESRIAVEVTALNTQFLASQGMFEASRQYVCRHPVQLQ